MQSALLSPRFIDPSAARMANMEPRVDLQLSPRNWKEKTPVGVPALSLPSVRGAYKSEPFQL